MTNEEMKKRAIRIALPMTHDFYVRDSCGNISGAPTESGCRYSARHGSTLVETVTYRFETTYERDSTADNDPLVAAEPDPIAAVRERDATIATERSRTIAAISLTTETMDERDAAHAEIARLRFALDLVRAELLTSTDPRTPLLRASIDIVLAAVPQ
jgi:hypothetical protein